VNEPPSSVTLVAQGSMVRRLVLTALGWALVLLVLGAMALTAVFRQTVLSDLDDRLSGVADALIAHVELSPDAGLRLDEALIDPRFSQTFSGRYWQVIQTEVSDPPPLRSESLADVVLEPSPQALQSALEAPGRAVISVGKGPEGEPLRLILRAFLLDSASTPLVAVAAEDRRPADRRVMQFGFTAAGLFVVFAIALGLGVFVQVRVALAPVLRMGRSVADVRDGREDRVSGAYPVELLSLASELNALLDHSREVVERARTHVGNLAHALKTPITVLSNEARDHDGALSAMVTRQTGVMQDQVEHHLRRARAAAHARTIGARTDVTQTLDELGRTLQKIYARQGIELTWSVQGAPMFRGEKQDFEELLGNLMDNACKWAAETVTVRARTQDASVELWVDDDGPGLTSAQREQVLGRGVRLDEQAPGTGLGLAIVVDLARAYEGELTLETSQLGGLRARLSLPGVVESSY